MAFEAIIAIGIFMSAVVLLNTHVFSRIDERGGREEISFLYRSAVYATDTLIKTPGYPDDWNETNYIQIGLEKEDFIVSQEKLESMMLLGNGEIARNIGLSGYNFFITINSSFNFTPQVSYEKGMVPDDPYLLVPVERIFLLENSTHRIPCKFRIEVWR